MFPGWRRTKSATSVSHSGSEKKMDHIISQLVTKPIPIFVESSIPRPDINSPTKRGKPISCGDKI